MLERNNALNFDSNHNTEIRAEIGERLRILLAKDQPRPPPRIQHLLDRLSTLDGAAVRSHSRRPKLA